MIITPFTVAQQFVGLKEVAGVVNNPLIVSMLQLDAPWVKDDETAWCSAFVNFVCKILNLPRSHSLAARSWLEVGHVVELDAAQVDADIVILKRGNSPNLGHVGFFAGMSNGLVHILGGNQGDMISIIPFEARNVIGVRRLI